MERTQSYRHFCEVIKKQAENKSVSLCEIDDIFKMDTISKQAFALHKLNYIGIVLDINISSLLFEIDDTPLEKWTIEF